MSKINYLGKCLLIEDEKSIERILVIGDLHIGYEEYLNRAGVFVSRKMFEEMIKEFDEIFEKTGKVDTSRFAGNNKLIANLECAQEPKHAQNFSSKVLDKIILLGDVKHDFGTIMKQEWKEVLGLFDYLEKKCSNIVVLKGNHDKILEPILNKKNILLRENFIWNEFCFLHGDRDFLEIHDKKIKYWIMGHGHPAVKLSDGVKIEKYKCFLTGSFRGKKIIIVPSFFSYLEGSDARENDLGLAWKFNFEKFEIKAVGENLEVLDFGLLGKIK